MKGKMAMAAMLALSMHALSLPHHEHNLAAPEEPKKKKRNGRAWDRSSGHDCDVKTRTWCNQGTPDNQCKCECHDKR